MANTTNTTNTTTKFETLSKMRDLIHEMNNLMIMDGITIDKYSQVMNALGSKSELMLLDQVKREFLRLETVESEVTEDTTTETIINNVKVVEEFPWVNSHVEGMGYDTVNSNEKALEKYKNALKNNAIEYMVKPFKYWCVTTKKKVYIDIYGQLLDKNMQPISDLRILGKKISKKFEDNRELLLYAVLHNCVSEGIKFSTKTLLTDDHKELANTDIRETGFVRKYSKNSYRSRLTEDQVTLMSKFVRSNCVGMSKGQTINKLKDEFRYNINEPSWIKFAGSESYTDISEKYFKYNKNLKRIEAVTV